MIDNTVFKTIRNKNNISQSALAKMTNMSRSAIAMIESGDRMPTDDFLINLSKIYKFDMVALVKNISKYESIEHYLLVNKLLNLINLRDDFEIKLLLENPTIENEFNYGEPLIIKQYCEVLVLLELAKDYNSAYEKCIDYLKINPSDIKNFQPKICMPNQYYSQILNFVYTLNSLEMFEEQLIICEIFVKFLEDTFFYGEVPLTILDSFTKKLYIICLNNLADTYFRFKKYNESLIICNNGISESNKLNVLSVLPMLIKLKIQILYCLEHFSEAKNVFEQFKSICEITNNYNYFESTMKIFKINYTMLFD